MLPLVAPHLSQFGINSLLCAYKAAPIILHKFGWSGTLWVPSCCTRPTRATTTKRRGRYYLVCHYSESYEFFPDFGNTSRSMITKLIQYHTFPLREADISRSIAPNVKKCTARPSLLQSVQYSNRYNRSPLQSTRTY